MAFAALIPSVMEGVGASGVGMEAAGAAGSAGAAGGGFWDQFAKMFGSGGGGGAGGFGEVGGIPMGMGGGGGMGGLGGLLGGGGNDTGGGIKGILGGLMGSSEGKGFHGTGMFSSRNLSTLAQMMRGPDAPFLPNLYTGGGPMNGANSQLAQLLTMIASGGR